MEQSIAFQEICATFRPRILAYLTRMVGPGEAEDLTQEVLMRIDRSLATFRGESKLSTWIYRIATNAALDRLRSPSYRQAAQVQSLDGPTAGERAGTAEECGCAGTALPSAEQQVVRQAMNECIREYIARLPEKYRTVLVLSDLEGFKDSEIAEILGITLGTVKIRLHRARLKFTQDLLAHCDPAWVEENEFLPDLKQFLS